MLVLGSQAHSRKTKPSRMWDCLQKSRVASLLQFPERKKTHRETIFNDQNGKPNTLHQAESVVVYTLLASSPFLNHG